jgi:hypothetical protein
MAFGLFSQTYMILMVIINLDSQPQFIWGEGE